MISRRYLLPCATGVALSILALDLFVPFNLRTLRIHEAILVLLVAAVTAASLAQLERLRTAERRLERAHRASLEGHWEYDFERKLRWHSASFRALLGHEAREMFGPIEQSGGNTHPDDRGVVAEAVAKHRRNGIPIDIVVRMRMANGSYRWMHMKGGVAERDASGEALRIAGAAQDVHEQKLAEDELREVRARFDRAVQGTQDGLWEIDLSGPHGRVWLSPRLHELLGFKDGELGDDPEVLRRRTHPEDRVVSDTAVQRQNAEGATLDVEVRMLTRGGEYRWFRLRGSPGFDGSGRIIRASGSMQDVTEARAAREALLRATEAAQAASRAKSTFLATMSHEIRTPMNGIIGMTALLLDTVLGRVQREYAEAIRTSANSLLAVINDILDFSKIEAGKLDLESLEMDLRGNVEEIGSMMALQAAMKSLELIVDVAPDVPQTVLGDPHRIRQCLVNLVSNAVKFTSTGEIVIELRVSERREKDVLLRFEVRDTGVGIAPEARAELFQPFTQADSSTTRRFGGTGLGLSIVKRLVQLMGGEVGVASEPGRGSTFWFTLPVTPVESSGRTLRPLTEGAGRRILIVDDNATNRRVLSGHLVHGQFEVQAASSAAEALELLERACGENRPYDVVLIDYQMPEMDGAMLGERIAGDPRLSRSRLVLLTSLDRKGDHTRFASMGFAAYLTKPVRARELRDCLQHVLAHDAGEWSTGTHPLVTRGTLANAATQRQYGGRVLVVEDNPVNQKVAQRFLERLGCSVRVAANGAEAVEASAAERFDLILMDMQMPIMDGISATRAIRTRESGGARTPIVALTANVLAGQFQSCLDSGMDDVLGKPLEPQRLQDVLERFVLRMPAGAAAATVEGHGGPSLAGAPIDLARLGSLAGDDTAFMRELLATFRSSAESAVVELRDSLAAGDRERLRHAAHKLKGGSDNIGAGRLRELASLIESGSPNASTEELTRWTEAVAAELAQLDGFFSKPEFATLAQRRAS